MEKQDNPSVNDLTNTSSAPLLGPGVILILSNHIRVQVFPLCFFALSTSVKIFPSFLPERKRNELKLLRKCGRSDSRCGRVWICLALEQWAECEEFIYFTSMRFACMYVCACGCVLPVCVHVHHACSWGLWRPEEGLDARHWSYRWY